MIAFSIWALVGCLFIGMGVYAHRTEKVMGFWANAKQFPVKDVKRYNRAVGKLFAVYGGVFILLGVPLLGVGSEGVMLITMVGVMMETIGIMVVYVVVIERKYRE